MPNRILRDTTDSEKVNSLSSQAEVLFYRLMMKADDYGSFHARPSLIKAALFPLRLDSVRETDITRWLAECEKAGLIAFYEADSKPYLVIVNFGQRMRSMKKRFPSPPDNSQQFAATCGNSRPETRNEIETETETETKRKNAHAKSLVLEPIEIQRRLIEEEFSVAEFIQQTYGLTEIQYQNSVKLFVGEKTAGHNELEKDFSDVLRHFKSWVRFNSDKLKRSAGPEKGKQSKVDDFLTAHKGAQSILDAENN